MHARLFLLPIVKNKFIQYSAIFVINSYGALPIMSKFVKAACAFAIIISTTSGGYFLSKPKISKETKLASVWSENIPNTEIKIDQYALQTKEIFDQDIEEFLSIDPNDRNFSNTITYWDRLGQRLTNRMRILKSVYITGASKETLAHADKAFEEIKTHVKAKLTSTPHLLLTIIDYVEKGMHDESLSSSENNYLYQLISSIQTSWLPPLYQNRLDEIQKNIALQPKESFTFRKGFGTQKELDHQKPSITLLNLNVCFLPDHLPLLYGGMTPWNHRIEKMAQRLLELDADIICLQEVFDDKASEELFQKLKEKYAYFYLNIGAKNFGFSPETSLLGSGLLVASKIALHTPRFVPFRDSTYQVNRGYFDFSIMQGNKVMAHIFNTHLEAFSGKHAEELRKKQLLSIVESMHKCMNSPLEKTSYVLCGDLNIPWASYEPAEYIKKEFFYDALDNCRTCVSEENHTFIDFTDMWWKAEMNPQKFSPHHEILDYAMILKKGPGHTKRSSEHPKIYTAVIPMNDVTKPFEALSDHHAEMSLIIFESSR
jgi:endonuclease/exonuclease/phosphatase family metal-dependent hydrolase